MGLFSSCEHDWSFSWKDIEKRRIGGWYNGYDIYVGRHKCSKCAKVEDCDFSVHAYGTVDKCSKCGGTDDFNDND